MIPEEKKSKHRLTQEDCETVRLLLARRRTLKEIAEIIGVDPSTVGKIRLAGYDLNTYLEQRRAMNRKTKERKEAAEAGRRRLQKALTDPQEWKRDVEEVLKDQAEGRFQKLPQAAKWLMGEEPKYMPPAEEVPGQMKMDLDQQEDNPEEDMRNYMLVGYDDRKQMKFQAALMDKLLKKLDELISVLKGGTGNG